MIERFFTSVGIKRITVMIIGNIFLGMGVSIFKFAGLGNDAFNGMIMALADCVGIAYAHLFLLIGIGLFVIELLFGRNFIGLGTIVNAFLLGYITTFFYNVWVAFFAEPGNLAGQIVVMLLGVLICSFGLSLYQTADAGVSPYDSLSLILNQRMKRIPYFWCRMFTDAFCALVCFLAGGLVGLGTLVAAFGFGPFIHFFNAHFTEKILGQKK